MEANFHKINGPQQEENLNAKIDYWSCKGLSIYSNQHSPLILIFNQQIYWTPLKLTLHFIIGRVFGRQGHSSLYGRLHWERYSHLKI